MAEGVVTLKERHRRKIERMAQAVAAIDAALVAYARQNGGRFIRYGSTATGRMGHHSDVDIIADFALEQAGRATTYAEEVCSSHGMPADARSIVFASPRLLDRALDEGVVLS
jgi:predicted nucleotidyltransferase